MFFDPPAFRDQLGKRRHWWFFLMFTEAQSCGSGLAEQIRDVLKPGHQWRRQINSRNKNKAKMAGRWQIGCFGRGGAPLWLAERQSLQPEEKRAKANQQADHERNGEERHPREG